MPLIGIESSSFEEIDPATTREKQDLASAIIFGVSGFRSGRAWTELVAGKSRRASEL